MSALLTKAQNRFLYKIKKIGGEKEIKNVLFDVYIQFYIVDTNVTVFSTNVDESYKIQIIPPTSLNKVNLY